MRLSILFPCVLGLALGNPALAQNTPASAASTAAPVLAANPGYDAELAKKAGANENGMRKYVFVILKSGPNKIPAGTERDDMFKGHFANIKKMAESGKLAVAGPLDGKEGRRGIFVLLVDDIEEARKLVEQDPVIVKGEMVADYHMLFASAALALIPELHSKVQKKAMF